MKPWFKFENISHMCTPGDETICVAVGSDMGFKIVSNAYET